MYTIENRQSQATNLNYFRTYDCTYDDWVHIKRADDEKHSLSEKAKKLASFYSKRLDKSGKRILVRPNRIALKTSCGRRQNYNIHRQLDNIFNIKFHNMIEMEGKRYFNVFAISYREGGKDILDNPKRVKNHIFEDAKIELNIENSKNLFKPGKAENIDDLGGKNEGGGRQFISTLYIDNSSIIINTPTEYLYNNTIDKPKKSNFNFIDFYPLSEADNKYLKKASDRPFNLNAMNEILLDMSKRVKGKVFNCKQAFLAYMGKVFMKEIREPSKVNNDFFKTKRNLEVLTEVERQAYSEKFKKERYLTKIENSLEVSPEWHFKKKIAAVFERDFAYDLLNSLDRIEIEVDIFVMHFKDFIEIKDFQKEIILNHAKASHDTRLGEQLRLIHEVKFVLPVKTTIKQEKDLKLSTMKGIWVECRKALICSIYYSNEEGIALDKSWYSKLKSEEDSLNKQIVLVAPNNFIRDWIKSNFSHHIERELKELGYSLKEIKADQC